MGVRRIISRVAVAVMGSVAMAVSATANAHRASARKAVRMVVRKAVRNVARRVRALTAPISVLTGFPAAAKSAQHAHSSRVRAMIAARALNVQLVPNRASAQVNAVTANAATLRAVIVHPVMAVVAMVRVVKVQPAMMAAAVKVPVMKAPAMKGPVRMVGAAKASVRTVAAVKAVGRGRAMADRATPVAAMQVASVRCVVSVSRKLKYWPLSPRACGSR